MASNENENEVDEKTEEYESDPEDSLLPALRRREAASDDEEESDGGEDLPPKKNEASISRTARSDGESDGQGGAEVYDDDDYDEDEEEYDEEYEEGLEEENENNVVKGRRLVELEGENKDGNLEENKEGEKKENEPYAVPTSGAFYMHDDRFQENARGGGGRRRRMHGGGRKIWNPKDERDWVHDRFEEVTIHEAHGDDDRRRPRGRYRGRGGGGGRGTRRVAVGEDRGGGDRGAGGRGGGYPRGGRASRSYYDDGQNNNKATRTFRGRGQRRYEPVNRNNPRNQPPQEKQIVQRTNEQGSNSTATNTNTRQHSQAQTSNTFSSLLPKKQSFSSSLNSASPPFYPSNASNSNQDLSTGMRRNARTGPILSDNRGKSIAAGSTLAPNSATAAVRVQGKGVMGTDNQISRVSSQAPALMGQHRQVSVTTNHQFTPASVQQVSGTSSGLGEDRINSGSPNNKLKGGISALKGKSLGSGALMYGGAQVISTTGPMSMPHGEQGFPGTPALLPVMQFSGQHHGVPAVGMALPGYVAQSQLGFGNSEMTWVPVLAGAAGSLGGSYAPYIALDGGYYNNAPRPSSQISSSAPAREAGAAKSSDGSKTSQNLEVPAEEPGQRQNKPRRYSEMNFGQ